MTKRMKALGLLAFFLVLASMPLLAQDANAAAASRANLYKWSLICATLVCRPGSISVIMFCCVTMRTKDSKGPPPTTFPAASSLRYGLNSPATSMPSVATIATGPLRNVLNITPVANTTIICNQIPR